MFKNLNITSKQETNEFADSRKSQNGGGYSQPEYKGTVTYNGEGCTFVFRDSSCGDFGTRYSLELRHCGDLVFSHYWGSMDDASLRHWHDEEQEDIGYAFIDALKEAE